MPSTRITRSLIGILIVLGVLLGSFFLLWPSVSEEKKITVPTSYKNAEYVIEGERVKLENGLAETEAAPDSESKVTTQYFGNELKTDLDGDGREDVAFVLTQNGGGSGTFFYAVGALNTDHRYVGSDGYFLGDRIAPQSTNISQNPRHKYVVVFNYADRASDEPMSARPSVGKSVYLKLNSTTMQWGIVEPDFEGESR